jgi:hypothetical protein
VAFIVKNDQEVIDLVNDTSYGFSTSIHTTNFERALNITKELDVRIGGVIFRLFENVLRGVPLKTLSPFILSLDICSRDSLESNNSKSPHGRNC